MRTPQITIHRNGDGLFHGDNGKSYQEVLPGTVPDKLQPHNIEAEQAVIGSLLIDPDAILKLSTRLTPGDFYIERYGWVFEVIQKLHAKNKPANLVVVSDELARRNQLREFGGAAALTELINDTPTSIHAEFYADIVARCAFNRRMIQAAGDIARLCHTDQDDPQDTANRAEEIIFGVTARQRESGLKPILAGMDAYLNRVQYLREHQDSIIGIPTGLTDLDKLLRGLQRSDLIILAGRPSMGKTSLALSIALQAARSYQQRIGLFSLEMSESQLINRLMASETGIDSQRLNFGNIHNDEWPRFIKASEMIAECSIFIDDTPSISAVELRSKARRLYAEHGLDLIVIDYLQLMTGDRKSENRTQEVSYISRSLKALARELNIPVLALSQLSRQVEGRKDKRPMLSDLRESGSLEQDSDVVLFIYRDEYYNADTEFPNIAEIILSKHRNGPTGVFSVYFKKHLAQFVDLEVRHQRLDYVDEQSIPRRAAEAVQDYVQEKY